MVILKQPDEIDKAKASSRIVAEVLSVLRERIKPGVTTRELDKIAESVTEKRGAKPAFKGYRGYPYSLCASVNEEVVHGMPSGRVLKEGDIVGLDFGVYYQGFYGDAAVTLPVGRVSEEAARLMRVTEQSLYAAIEQASSGSRLGDISAAVQETAESAGYSVVRDFVGHGIGRNMHEDPQIPNFGKKGRGTKLQPGMILCIEPMINEGSWQVITRGWDARTADGKLSSRCEHMVLITPTGHEVLTRFLPY